MWRRLQKATPDEPKTWAIDTAWNSYRGLNKRIQLKSKVVGSVWMGVGHGGIIYLLKDYGKQWNMSESICMLKKKAEAPLKNRKTLFKQTEPPLPLIVGRQMEHTLELTKRWGSLTAYLNWDGNLAMEQVAALPWNGWQPSRGLGGRFHMEWAAILLWNTQTVPKFGQVWS